MSEDPPRPEQRLEDESDANRSSAGPNEQAAAPGAESPEVKIAAVEAERDELRDRLLRIAADFDNYKKRVRKETAEAETKGKESVLRDMLEVVDNLERAAAAGETVDIKSIQQGVGLVLRLFQSKLERHDVRPFEAKGQPFDPRVHDAISQVPSADVAPGSVLSELQRGYRLGEKLLRPALVVVALAPPAGSGSGDGAGGGSGGRTDGPSGGQGASDGASRSGDT